MTSPYVESTPILSLAERRESIEQDIEYALRRIDFWQHEQAVAAKSVHGWLERITQLRAALANLSED